MNHHYHIKLNSNEYIGEDNNGKWNTTNIISKAKKFSNVEIAIALENFEQSFGIPIDDVIVIPILKLTNLAVKTHQW